MPKLLDFFSIFPPKNLNLYSNKAKHGFLIYNNVPVNNFTKIFQYSCGNYYVSKNCLCPMTYMYQ